MKVFSDKAAAVLSFLQARPNENLMATDIAAGTGIETKSITGVLNGLQRKGLVTRATVDGFDKKIIRLTDSGKNADPMEEKSEPVKVAAN